MELNKPSISIAMATYNGDFFLKEQINSILNQTYKDFELIISDDGSTDNTVQIIKSYIKKYPFIKLYQNKIRLGFVKNFEKAIILSNGKYITLSDQDDIWYPDKLSIYIKEIQKEEKLLLNTPIMIHSDLSVIDINNKLIYKSYFKFKKYKLKESKDLGHIASSCGVMGNTIFFNQKLKDIILPFPEVVEFHDYWIALVTELQGKRVTIKKSLVKYRIHSKNSSNYKNKFKTNFLSIIYKYLKNRVSSPFISSKRSAIIDIVIDRFNLDTNDKTLLREFQFYLKGEKSKYLRVYYLLKNSLLKRDLKYRIVVIIYFLIYAD